MEEIRAKRHALCETLNGIDRSADIARAEACGGHCMKARERAERRNE